VSVNLPVLALWTVKGRGLLCKALAGQNNIHKYYPKDNLKSFELLDVCSRAPTNRPVSFFEYIKAIGGPKIALNKLKYGTINTQYPNYPSRMIRTYPVRVMLHVSTWEQRRKLSLKLSEFFGCLLF
jgi:hypothetical protein